MAQAGWISTATRPPLLVIFRRTPLPAALHLFRSVGTRHDNDDPTTPIYSQSQDKKKKQHHAHRLASVIDAVNDRKLPPELRSRPNAIRYFPTSPYSIINCRCRFCFCFRFLGSLSFFLYLFIITISVISR